MPRRILFHDGYKGADGAGKVVNPTVGQLIKPTARYMVRQRAAVVWPLGSAVFV
ncbi:MAG: hypothetical protein IPH85_13995 [Ignavibacteria bacterium]|nr:hypothetical protein [Ignavibacteria bacterium]